MNKRRYMETIKKYYDKYYDELDDFEVSSYSYGYDWLFDNNKLFKAIADEFIRQRKDFISSDREAAAFCKAMEVIGKNDNLVEFVAREIKDIDFSLADVAEIEKIEENFNDRDLERGK